MKRLAAKSFVSSNIGLRYCHNSDKIEITTTVHKFIFKRDRGAFWIGLKYFLFILSFAAGVLGGYYITALWSGPAVFVTAVILILLVTYMIVSYLHLKKTDTL